MVFLIVRTFVWTVGREWRRSSGGRLWGSWRGCSSFLRARVDGALVLRLHGGRRLIVVTRRGVDAAEAVHSLAAAVGSLQTSPAVVQRGQN